MCLQSEGIKEAVKKTGVGYKVFEQDKAGRLFSVYMNMGGERPQEQWLPSFNWQFSSKPNDSNVGWHIYLRRKDASNMLKDTRTSGNIMVLRRVKYRGAHHVGVGDGGWNKKAQVVVAKEMFILKKNGRA